VTLLDLVIAAFQEIGVLAEGEVPTAYQGADALKATNRMLDQWQAESLQFFLIQRTTWPIISGTSDYSVGLLSGTIVAPRPVSSQFISQINILDSASTPSLESPLVPLTLAQYAAIPQKTLTNTVPTSWYYDPIYPLGIVKVLPVPTATTLTCVLLDPRAINAFANLSDTIALPPGYEELLVTNLAVRLATPYSRQVDPSLRERATDAKAIVKRANSPLVDLTFPADALMGNGYWRGDIRSGP
jgi:hypothetical protein